MQKIQSLENFVSMAIQGTQVPMYTKHTLFLYFFDFSKKIYFYMKNKNKQNWKQTNKNMLSKAKLLTQNKSETHKLCKNKNTKIEKKVIESLGALFLLHPRRTFPLIKPLNRRWGGRIETDQVWKEHEGFEKISKGSKKGLKLILAFRCYHTIALLSG